MAIPCHFWMFAEHGGSPAQFLDACKELAPESSRSDVAGRAVSCISKAMSITELPSWRGFDLRATRREVRTPCGWATYRGRGLP